MKILLTSLRRSVGFALLIIFQVSTAFAADVIQVRTNYYSVRGESARELRRSLDLNRPRVQSGPHDAVTTWRIEWKSNVEKKNGVCELSFFETKTTVIITLPSWATTTNATPELKRLWKNYYSALMTHEWGHAQMAQAAAAEMQARVREVSARDSCEEYKRVIAERAAAVVRETERQQKDYDERTRHGATQGAVWRSGGRIQRGLSDNSQPIVRQKY